MANKNKSHNDNDIWILIIVIFGVALVIAAIRGGVPSDDDEYCEQSHDYTSCYSHKDEEEYLEKRYKEYEDWEIKNHMK